MARLQALRPEAVRPRLRVGEQSAESVGGVIERAKPQIPINFPLDGEKRADEGSILHIDPCAPTMLGFGPHLARSAARSFGASVLTG